MSLVYFAIPSKKPAAEAQVCIDKWRSMGYKTAIWRDDGDEEVECDLLMTGEYQGYALAVNALCGAVLLHDADAEWIVTGGDDTDPDLTHDPRQIAFECGRHFGEEQQVFRMEPTLHSELGEFEGRFYWSTFGVMQPTGDRWGETPGERGHSRGRGAYIDLVAGSPWLGREWCRRMYGGQGPLWPGWTHMHVDDELQALATKLGVFWQRPDLVHYHNHWGRTTGRMPEYMRRANAEFNVSAEIFRQRKAAGFPGHQPI